MKQNVSVFSKAEHNIYRCLALVHNSKDMTNNYTPLIIKQLHSNNIKRCVCHELTFWHLSYHQLRINSLDVLIYSVFTSISLTSLHCAVLSCRLLTNQCTPTSSHLCKNSNWSCEHQSNNLPNIRAFPEPFGPKKMHSGPTGKSEAANDDHLRAVKRGPTDQQTDRQQRAACLTNIKEHTAGKIHPHPALLPSHMAHFQF